MDFALIARVLSMRRGLRSRERWSADQMSAHREEQLRGLRAHAYAHSPFYRRFHGSAASKPLNELRVLTKAELISHFDEPASHLTESRDVSFRGPDPGIALQD